MAIETELKLAVSAADADRVEEVEAIQVHVQGEPRSVSLVNIYFDTPDRDLERRGYGLRLRRKGERWFQTLKKASGPGGALHARHEWEHEVAGPALEPAHFPAREARRWLAGSEVMSRLMPVFTTEFGRTIRDLELSDGTRIEMAVDRGHIRAEPADAAEPSEAPILEVELELVAGAPARLFEIAETIHAAVPVRLETRSKAERGYALVYGRPLPTGEKAGPVRFDSDRSAGDVLQVLLRHSLRHWLRNEPVVRENPADIEGVHQMRVATRRLRSGLRLYRPLITAETCRDWNRRVKWLTDALGPARDWDVLLDETLDSLAAQWPDHPELAALVHGAKARRREAYVRAIEALDSPRYTELTLSLAAWIEGRVWREALDEPRRARLDAPARDFAVGVLKKHHRRVCDGGERFHALGEEERHRLRIEAKRLRYSAEFFAALWGGKAVRPYTRALARLQDVLGVLNDAVVSRRLLTEIEAPAPGAVGLVLGWKSAVMHEHLAGFDRAWKAFSDVKPFWRKK